MSPNGNLIASVVFLLAVVVVSWFVLDLGEILDGGRARAERERLATFEQQRNQCPNPQAEARETQGDQNNTTALPLFAVLFLIELAAATVLVAVLLVRGFNGADPANQIRISLAILTDAGGLPLLQAGFDGNGRRGKGNFASQSVRCGMPRLLPVWLLIGCVLTFGPVTWRLLSRKHVHPPAPEMHLVHAGEVLFHHEWQVNDPLCPDGDGLGPVFNARSCVACHNQGGAGGGGERNVTDFTIAADRGSKVREGVIHAEAISEKFRETLNCVDPSLPKTGVSEMPRAQLMELMSGTKKSARMARPQVRISQRNTPALFGAGLIDTIPDHVIIANEKRSNGRAPRLADGRLGRFGWKGQTARLSDFVQAACANELGLSNPGHPQPQSLADPSYEPQGLDLSQLQCDQLTAFVAALPQPREKLPATAWRRQDVAAGKKLFTNIGCADCHMPNVGKVHGIYSDLLLHRMGEQLTGNSGTYGRQAPSEPSAPPDEWRTPPLWGIASSAPYMHDGRAATLREAIAMHGGQAERSQLEYGRLAEDHKNLLLDFLNTLQAP
jgi:CxxC motif-containing protein (DUF1111 family)